MFTNAGGDFMTNKAPIIPSSENTAQQLAKAAIARAIRVQQQAGVGRVA